MSINQLKTSCFFGDFFDRKNGLQKLWFQDILTVQKM